MSVKIDETDAKILRTFLSESRTSFTAIANQCQITVTAVRMRYKRLWRQGLINGEIMLVNPHSLGYDHIADLGVMASAENELEVKHFLENKPYIGGLIGPMGRYRFWGKVALKNIDDLRGVIEDLESNSSIQHVDALIWAESTNIEYSQNLVIKPLDHDNPEKIIEQHNFRNFNLNTPDLDQVDQKIALILSQNSRTPFKNIAKQLNITSKTVIHRYKKLRKNLLTLSTITVDLTKLGYNALGNIFIKMTNRSKMPEMYTQLLQIPNVIVIIRLMDGYDVYGAVVVRDFADMFDIKNKVMKISGIQAVDIYLTKLPPAWPLNLFPSLLENQCVKPKYWTLQDE